MHSTAHTGTRVSMYAEALSHLTLKCMAGIAAWGADGGGSRSAIHKVTLAQTNELSLPGRLEVGSRYLGGTSWEARGRLDLYGVA